MFGGLFGSPRTVYLEVVNATMRRTVLGLEQDTTTGLVKENSYLIVLPSLGIRGTL